MNVQVNEHDPLLIEEVSNLLQVSPAVIEKDLYVTQALHALSMLENEFFQLVFQGGTCLAKAYKVIERMSEDCDFRIVTSPLALNLGKEALRRHLREFRKQIVSLLQQSGFKILADQIKVGNAGQYMNIDLEYTAIFPVSIALRPHLKLEFIAMNTRLPIAVKIITSLISQSLKDQITQEEKALPCVSIVETAAEKWVAFTRRVATITRGYRQHDPTLVRHLYDLCRLNQSNLLTEDFYSLVHEVIQSDRKYYRTQNPEYIVDSVQEIKFALMELENDKKWQKDWRQFINAMVFRREAPSYS